MAIVQRNLWQRLLLNGIAFGSVVFSLLDGAPNRAQTAQTTGSPLPSFEVVSINRDRSGEAHGMFMFRPGRFTATCVPIAALMAYAYRVRDFQISGGPDWVRSERFDIVAKEPDELAEEMEKLPSDQRNNKNALLLQSMLADRFKVRVNQETRELPIYALVVANNGPKLQEAEPGIGIKPHTRHFQMGKDYLTADGLDMPTLAFALSQQLSRPVLDQTGIKGNYKLALNWTPDPGLSQFSGDSTSTSSTTETPSPSASSGPSIFTAIQEQLGLKLESTKGPVEILVIDHIEKPSEN